MSLKDEITFLRDVSKERYKIIKRCIPQITSKIFKHLLLQRGNNINQMPSVKIKKISSSTLPLYRKIKIVMLRSTLCHHHRTDTVMETPTLHHNHNINKTTEAPTSSS